MNMSSSYVEGRYCELARFGHSRDGRHDKMQIVFGPLCSAEECPIAIEVFEGNTGGPSSDHQTQGPLWAQTCEAAAKAKGVKRVCIPNRSTKSPERKREQRKRWATAREPDARDASASSNGDIASTAADTRAPSELDRWVGLGVIADNVVNIGRAMEKKEAP